MKPRANASALLCFVLLATLTVLVVIDFPGVASVQPMFRGGNGEAGAAATNGMEKKPLLWHYPPLPVVHP